jgi:hypothetical protein
MRLLDVTADRLVSLLVSKTTAAACGCTLDSFWEACLCTGGRFYARSCSYDCNCREYCSACYDRGTC